MFAPSRGSERMREEIESRLNIVALNVYGLSEVIGPRCSIECTEKQGMHTFEDHFHSRDHRPQTPAKRLRDGEMESLSFTCGRKRRCR